MARTLSLREKESALRVDQLDSLKQAIEKAAEEIENINDPK